MKLFLSKEDAEVILRATGVDLPDLISQAGHECFIEDISKLTSNSLSFDKVIPYRQNFYNDYARALEITLHTPETHQPELKLLDKAYANTVLEDLGLNYLNTKTVFNRDDIVSFSDNTVILKPKIGMWSKSDYNFTYIVLPKDELLTKIDASDIDLSSGDYLIQEGVTNGKPILWIGGYVNPQGDIHVDGALSQTFSINDKHFEDILRYPDRHQMLVEEIPLNELDEFYTEAIRQIKVVLTHVNAKSTPFCIQAIIDDDNEVQLLDFNLSFGKGYMLSVRRNNPEYIIERIKYTYGGVDSIQPNNTFMMNLVFDTPNGFTDDIKEYIKDKPMLLGMGQPDKDYTFYRGTEEVKIYHRYRSNCALLTSSREEAYQIRDNFKLFLETL